MMTSAQVVETSVNVTSNSPSQDYTHPDDHNLPNYDMTPGFKPFTVAMAVGDLAITKGIPYLAKKSVEAGRYYASEAMRDPKLQKKAINYTLDKARPVIQKVGSEMLDQLSTKVRPNQRYKTDRPDLDGAGFDIHAAIGKFPKPKKGWTLPGHNFTGPYNPLEKEVKYDPETGEILEIYQPPTGATDAIAMQHDVDYDVCSNREKNTVKISKNANTKRIKKW